MPRRLAQLLLGLFLYGLAEALIIRAALGIDPWTAFAQGISLVSGLSIGLLTNIIGVGVLLLWIPLRQRPGIGTVLNVLLLGPFMEVGLWLVPAPTALWQQVLLFAGGLLLLAVASGVYIGARLGPGPRDGLMTGLRTRLGWPIWLGRGLVEGTVLAVGWMLGGNVGVGTVLFALLIGPLCGVTLRWFGVTRPSPRASREPSAPARPRASRYPRAAALAARFVSRTRVSESASTMSATER